MRECFLCVYSLSSLNTTRIIALSVKITMGKQFKYGVLLDAAWIWGKGGEGQVHNWSFITLAYGGKRLEVTLSSMAEYPAKDQLTAMVSGPCVLQRKKAACGQETLGNLGGSTLGGGGGGGTGGVVGTGCTMQDRAVGLERVAAYIVGVGGAGIAQWLEHRTRDWKVAGSNPCWNGGRIFFSRVDFLCWLLFRYPFHPRVTTVARKKSRSFCQKCRWQVTAKHAYTLRMWILLNRASALVTTCP